MKDRSACFACVPYPTPEELEGRSRQKYILEKFAYIVQLRPDYFAELSPDSEPLFFWPLTDVRCKSWVKGRVVLLGDAAAAFLPSAGIGASMAMESAAVLNDVLSRTNSEHLSTALEFFVKRRKKRVEDAQQDSRRLIKMILTKGYVASKLRNIAFKFQTVQSILNTIAKDFEEPI